jgi:hypothetical protein
MLIPNPWRVGQILDLTGNRIQSELVLPLCIV